jgi:hypothetical protein
MEKKTQEESTAPLELAGPQDSQSSEGDLFNIDKLRLSQDFSALVGVKKAIMTVPVRKPGRQEFIRVRPGEEWYLETAILELKEERESYLVSPGLWPELSGEIVPKVLFTVMSRQGTLTLWPVRLPGEDGRLDPWNRSALEAAEMAKRRWIRVTANMALGAYEVCEATANIPEPEWPDTTFEEVLRIAFKDRFIDRVDHSVINRLRGAT